MPWVKCRLCDTEFYAKPFHQRKGWGIFCSHKCSWAAKLKGKHVECDICKKEVYRAPRQLRNSRSNKFFCTKACFAVWKNQNLFIGEKHGKWVDGHAAYRTIMKRNGIVAVCSGCGIDNLKVLVVHHIDEDRTHNDISNLKWLCRNCHYLIHNGRTF